MKNRIRPVRKAHGMTMKELGVMLGLNESTISQYENGHRQPNYETLLRIGEIFGVSVGYLLYAEDNILPSPASNIIPMPGMKQIPLIGTIACGEPILAQENIEGEISMPEHIHADFALRCKGDSMINARIFDGDMVYIRMQDTIDSGEIAAVLVDGNEATLKRVHLYPDHISLEPENPQYRPLVFWNEEMEKVRIIGKAVAFTSAIL